MNPRRVDLATDAVGSVRMPRWRARPFARGTVLGRSTLVRRSAALASAPLVLIALTGGFREARGEASCEPGGKTITVTVNNPGTASLTDCTAIETLYPHSPTCPPTDTSNEIAVPLEPPDSFSLESAQSRTLTGILNDLAMTACSRTTVTCKVAGTDKQITATNDGPCVVTTTTTSTSTSTTTSTTLGNPCPSAPGAGYAFLFLRRGRIGNGAIIQANAGVNDVGGLLQLGKSVTVTPENVVAGDTVKLGNASVVHRVLTNNLLMGKNVVIGAIGPVSLPLVGTDPCPVGPVTCAAGSPQHLQRGERATLGPPTFGPVTYGQLVLRNNAHLTLRPGDYTFCSIHMARASSLTILGPERTTIRVAGSVRIANNATFGPGAGAPTPNFEIEGSKLRVGARAFLQAFIKAPFAELSVGRNGQIKGTFCIESSRSDKAIMLMCPPDDFESAADPEPGNTALRGFSADDVEWCAGEPHHAVTRYEELACMAGARPEGERA